MNYYLKYEDHLLWTSPAFDRMDGPGGARAFASRRAADGEGPITIFLSATAVVRVCGGCGADVPVKRMAGSLCDDCYDVADGAELAETLAENKSV